MILDDVARTHISDNLVQICQMRGTTDQHLQAHWKKSKL